MAILCVWDHLRKLSSQGWGLGADLLEDLVAEAAPGCVCPASVCSSVIGIPAGAVLRGHLAWWGVFLSVGEAPVEEHLVI